MTYFVNRSVHRGLAAILVLRGGSGIRAQESWLESKAAHYSVFYQSGFEQDVPRVRAWADSAERLMRSKYGVVPTHYRLSIYLHPAPTAVAPVDNARNHCCSDSSDGIKTGTIDMLAPSAPAFKASSEISSLGTRVVMALHILVALVLGLFGIGKAALPAPPPPRAEFLRRLPPSQKTHAAPEQEAPQP